MNLQLRRLFDEQMEWVLKHLPPMVHELLEQVPLHVEDHPSKKVMRELGVQNVDELCGLYTGIPLGQKSIWHSGVLPDVVTIYRSGILAAAADRRGRVSRKRLREEIRRTVLHEIAHHHGLSEEELEQLGYG